MYTIILQSTLSMYNMSRIISCTLYADSAPHKMYGAKQHHGDVQAHCVHLSARLAALMAAYQSQGCWAMGKLKPQQILMA